MTTDCKDWDKCPMRKQLEDMMKRFRDRQKQVIIREDNCIKREKRSK